MDGENQDQGPTWLIAGWREAWRFSSLWFGTFAIGALTVWNMMPPAVRDVVPDPIELAIGGVLWGGLVVSRIAKQPRSQARIDAKRAAQCNEYDDWADRAHG